MAARCARCVFRGYIFVLVVVPVARCRAAALMRRRNVDAAASVNRQKRIFAGTIGFLVRRVMSVPRQNTIMRW